MHRLGTVPALRLKQNVFDNQMNERSNEDMFLFTVTIVVLSVLYGLAWHDEPAHRSAVVQRNQERQGSK